MVVTIANHHRIRNRSPSRTSCIRSITGGDESRDCLFGDVCSKLGPAPIVDPVVRRQTSSLRRGRARRREHTPRREAAGARACGRRRRASPPLRGRMALEPGSLATRAVRPQSPSPGDRRARPSPPCAGHRVDLGRVEATECRRASKSHPHDPRPHRRAHTATPCERPKWGEVGHLGSKPLLTPKTTTERARPTVARPLQARARPVHASCASGCESSVTGAYRAFCSSATAGQSGRPEVLPCDASHVRTWARRRALDPPAVGLRLPRCARRRLHRRRR